MSYPSRLVTTATLASLALLGLSACAPTAAPGGETSAPPSPAQTAANDGALSLEAPGCLIGDWYISQDELQGFYDSVTEASGSGVAFVVDGDTGLSFDGAQFEYTPDLTLTIGLPGSEGIATLIGSISGAYAADSGTVITSSETVDVEYTYSIGGVTQDATTLFGSAITTAPIGGGEFECTPVGPLVQFDNGFGRVPVQLVPAT